MEQLDALMAGHLQGRPSWVALLGPRKIGKTSILRELRRRTQSQGAIVVVVDLFQIDARVQDVFAAFLGRLLAGACEGAGHKDLAGRIQTRLPSISGELAHEVSTALPFTGTGRALELIDAMRSTHVSNEQIREVLALPEMFAQELGPIWVILDEVQELEALNRQKPFNKRHTIFRLMRSVWQEHEKVSYWATGSQVSMLATVFTDRRAPFHGHFQIVPVGPFESDDAVELLLNKTDDSRKAADAREAAELATETLGGHPFYLQVLGEEIELRRVELSVKSVKSVLQETLLAPMGRLALHLQGIIEADAGSGQQLAVLRALARRPSTLAELVSANPSLTRDSTSVLLRRLEQADLVVRDAKAPRFEVADRALAAYLRVGGVASEPAPSVLGDAGERAAVRHLMDQGIRPVYQSYRSLGPADLVVLEPDRRLAFQVKRSPLPLYIKETEYQRLLKWASDQSLLPVLCQVEPESPDVVRYWRWAAGRKTGKRRRFDEGAAVTSVLELLD